MCVCVSVTQTSNFMEHKITYQQVTLYAVECAIYLLRFSLFAHISSVVGCHLCVLKSQHIIRYTFHILSFKKAEEKKTKTIQATSEMASIQSHLNISIVMIILLVYMLLRVSQSMEIRESDYEIHVKNSDGKTYIAYVIEQTDIVVKHKCTCISRNKCDSKKNMIKLSK